MVCLCACDSDMRHDVWPIANTRYATRVCVCVENIVCGYVCVCMCIII